MSTEQSDTISNTPSKEYEYDTREANLDPHSVKSIGVACKTCSASIAWDVAFCPKCGETFPFEPRIKTQPNARVPTAKEAEANYQANLEAAFRAAGNAGKAQAHSQQKIKDKRDAKRRIKENKYKGTIVKPHTFSSYGIKTSTSSSTTASNGNGGGKRGNNVIELESDDEENSNSQHPRQPQTIQPPQQSTVRRRSKKRGRRGESSYDQSRTRLLQKEPSLLQKDTVLNPGAASRTRRTRRKGSSKEGNDEEDDDEEEEDLTPINKNRHLTDVLVTLAKIEKAEGNLLPAGSYERAALSLSRHNVKIMNSNDLSTVRAVDICAQSKIEEILHSETRRQMGGGKDIMVHASELIASFQQNKKNSDTPQMKQAKLRLVAMLEEEQERERERESFWREKGTQSRSENEKKELLQIFESERQEGANLILNLLPVVLGREKTLNMITSMTINEDNNHGNNNNADRRERQNRRDRNDTPERPWTGQDSGWLGGEDNEDNEDQYGNNTIQDGGGSVLPEMDYINDNENEDEQQHSTHHSTHHPTQDTHLPSLLPFAQHVLDTEDEMRLRHSMPGYKRNNLTINNSSNSSQMNHNNNNNNNDRWEEEEYSDEEYYENNREEEMDISPMKNHLNSRQMRYLKIKATKNIATNAQNKRQEKQIRKRPKQLPVQVGKEVMMLNVLDDGWQDNIPKVIPNMSLKNVANTMIDLSDGILSKPTPAVTTGLFWGPSLNIVVSPTSGQQQSNPVDSTMSQSSSFIGGGAFWGSTTTTNNHSKNVEGKEEKKHRLKQEQREQSMKIVDVSDTDDDDDDDEEENNQTETYPQDTTGKHRFQNAVHQIIHERSWQKRRRLRNGRLRKILKRKKKFTNFICQKMKNKDALHRSTGRININENQTGDLAAMTNVVIVADRIDLSDRNPVVGGIGTLKLFSKKKKEVLNEEKEKEKIKNTPMLTSGCSLPGSINNGRGAYAIVTIISSSGASSVRGDVVIHGYLPKTGAEISLDLTKDEVQFLLGGEKINENNNLITTRSILASSRKNTERLTSRSITSGRSTNAEEAEAEKNKKTSLQVIEEETGTGMEFLDAMDVQTYGASLKYMRPYWKKHIGPLLSRLEVHDEPIGGIDFSTRVPSLQLDRCILSRTRYEIPIVRDQEYMKTSFPPNTKKCTLIIRLERNLNAQLDDIAEREGAKKNTTATTATTTMEEDDAIHLQRIQETSEILSGVNKLKRKKIKTESRSDLALSCTVVFRGGSSYGLSGTTTCRCVLPFDLMAAKILLTQGKGIQHFEDPMDVVRKGRRDDLMESVISHLRLCMLGEGKFVKACSLKDVRSGSNELQLLFDWQKPKRDLIVGDPIDESILKFLMPHQREMIRIYRQNVNKEEELLNSMIPKTPPPIKVLSQFEIDQKKAIVEVEDNIRKETAATRIQTIVRRNLASEKVNEIRSNYNIQLEDEQQAETEEEEEAMDSDVEDVDLSTVIYRKKIITHLNGKLVDLRMRVISGMASDGSYKMIDPCVHVKIIEPKSQKVARIKVNGEKLMNLSQEGENGHVLALENVENPFHIDVSQKGGNDSFKDAAVLCSNIFDSLLLFQSRAQGLLLLRLREPMLNEEDGGNDDNDDNDNNDDNNDNEKNDADTNTRTSISKKKSSLTKVQKVESLSASPMMSPMVLDQDTSVELALSPSQPSAPKHITGSPPTLDDFNTPRDEKDDVKIPIEEMLASASKLWRPDSAVERPDNVPKLPIKQLKYGKRR